MNRNLVLAAIVTGILCGAWAGLAPLVGLSIWAGFAGCTAYFALGTPGLKGLALTLSTTLVGILTALGMIALGDLIGTPAGTGIAVGVIVPGIFVGCYSTFAIDADWRLLASSLVAGAVLGLLCQRGGELAGTFWGQPEQATPETASVPV